MAQPDMTASLANGHVASPLQRLDEFICGDDWKFWTHGKKQ
jgi:hypothetical protein